MDLLSHFDIELNHDQKEAINRLALFLESNDQVFLLKGYAGTGKTTLIKGLIKYLLQEKKQFEICAPTGRAAKILRNKTGYGSTIHSTIYSFDNLVAKNAEAKDEASHSFEYFFPLKELAKETVIIVDEASMISSRFSKNELFDFGTNILLNDLLTFSRLQMKNNNKLIVIGDPAQLLPVGDNNSWALEKSFYVEKNLSVSEGLLTEVVRQNSSLILENAFKIRSCIEKPDFKELQFSFDNTKFINLNGKNLVQRYCELFPKTDFDNGVIITYSNAQNLHYNQEIRNEYFPGKVHISEGDIVQIINNNYSTYKTKIYNGDFAMVISVGETVKHSAPVFVDENGRKVKKIIDFTFKKVILSLPDFDEDIEAFIHENLLESTSRDLSINEMKALYINAVMRFRDSNKNERVGSENFKNFLKNDVFFNALRVKYGYAITGHKSQGGEWKTVFVDYYGRVSLKKEPLRWSYTATTRASECVYATNYPNFGKYYLLKFSDIGTFSNIPEGAFSFENVPLSPFHKITDHKCKSWLYWNIMDKCQNTVLKIKNIASEEWTEKYTIELNDEILIAQISHNAAGYFSTDFKTTSVVSSNTKEYVLAVLNARNEVVFKNNYKPSEDFLTDLYTVVQAASNDTDVRITNVVEKLENYFVSYYFETDNPLSYIQFFFKKTKEFSTAIVKTFGATDDIKLKNLLMKIEDYANSSS
ncbi:ATP-dependent RecD-like DNA helicase [Kaistella sp.]|uniref:ATP-dependent DNA helicase n=1 Tax=Kaistella sp. TaxID=2782235 RepID=UPI00359F9574